MARPLPGQYEKETKTNEGYDQDYLDSNLSGIHDHEPIS